MIQDTTEKETNEELTAPPSSASKGMSHCDSMLVMSTDGNHYNNLGVHNVDYHDDDDDGGGFFMDDLDDFDNFEDISAPPPPEGIPPMISLSLVPDTPIVVSTSSTQLAPHPRMKRNMSFGVPEVPNTTIAKLKPCTSTGDLNELIEKAELEHVKGITPTTGGGMRRSTSLISFKEEVMMEHIDNFTLELKKAERHSVWYSDREMKLIQCAALEKQLIEKEDKEALEKKNSTKKKEKNKSSRRPSFTNPLKKSTSSNSIKDDIYYNDDSKSANSNNSKKQERRMSKQKSWSKKAKGFFSSK